jgi:orotidine-5'-phosphate decarboxylase
MSRPTIGTSQYGPLCVGVDPSPALLDAWGLPVDAEGLDRFGSIMIDAMHGLTGVLKPQVAFWEAHGSAGYSALEQFIARARQREFLVVADAKCQAPGLMDTIKPRRTKHGGTT